ncbi:MAG: aromatic aminobenezylarsenical efflux permease ArsG family transporter [Candidatus Zixiibacteriota bacterium]
MIESYWLAGASAFWLGLLTSISPCPLATNIVAVTYISRHLKSPRHVAWAGVAYTLGRTFTYTALGLVLVFSLASAVEASELLQTYMNRILGPLLILAGMILLDLLRVRLPGRADGKRWSARFMQGTIWSSGILGVLFALSFCPVSAALFFGSLIPMAVSHQSYASFPILYGLGTGLPVAILGVGLGIGAGWVSRALHGITVVEVWSRRVTGAVFILAGIYLSLKYVFALL